MQAKIVKLNRNNNAKNSTDDETKQLSFEECKKVLNSNDEHYTDEEINYLKDVLQKFATLNYIYFIECKQKENRVENEYNNIENSNDEISDNNNIIPLKINANNETQSHIICKSEYRRAS